MVLPKLTAAFRTLESPNTWNSGSTAIPTSPSSKPSSSPPTLQFMNSWKCVSSALLGFPVVPLVCSSTAVSSALVGTMPGTSTGAQRSSKRFVPSGASVASVRRHAAYRLGAAVGLSGERLEGDRHLRVGVLQVKAIS